MKRNLHAIIPMALLVTLFILAAESSPATTYPVKELAEVSSGLTYSLEQPPIKNDNLFKGRRDGFLVSHGVQESELTYPIEYLKARGAKIDILAPDWIEDQVLLVKYVKPTRWIRRDRSFSEASQSNAYDLLILTGGAWNSQVVRSDHEAIRIIKKHYDDGKPIAAICAGSQILINANLASDRRLTGTKSIKVDLENAGALYLDQPVVVDRGILTSRGPEDLEIFVETFPQLFD